MTVFEITVTTEHSANSDCLQRLHNSEKGRARFARLEEPRVGRGVCRNRGSEGQPGLQARPGQPPACGDGDGSDGSHSHAMLGEHTSRKRRSEASCLRLGSRWSWNGIQFQPSGALCVFDSVAAP